MTIVNKKFYIDSLEEIEVCGSKFFSFGGGAFQLPYDIQPADGEHNYSVCSGCTKQREHIINEIKRVYKFPNCCEWHKKLHQFRDFKISDFTGIEGSVADKILFTHQFVINHIENDDWFEDFENYFEYVVDSLGSFPNGYGSPYALNNFCGFLPDLVEGIKDKYLHNKMPKEEIDRRIDVILNHINNSFYPIEDEKKIISASNTGKDMNLLLSTYNKWYKTFPFELSYFKPLQQKYGRTLPILDGNFRYNKYTGLTTAKLQTKENFTQFLVQLTKNIITNINGLRLYEKGLLTDAQNIRLELIMKNRDLELSAINSVKGVDSKGYIKILKSWFASEKKFIKEITPLLKEEDTTVKEKTPPELSIKQIALKLVYEGAVVNRSNCSEIIKGYGHTSGDKLFQEFTYFSSLANRKGNPSPATEKKFQNKIELFESVIELLSDANKQRALDELNILKMNRDNLFE